ncbi:MAG: MGMT family protein [Candidatus Micrarchaeia archaeon]
MTSAFQDMVFRACAAIPRGRVSTYSRIALAIGRPGSARAVGNALNRNRSQSVPCHRVVMSDGRVGGFAHGQAEKIRMLVSEGLNIECGSVSGFRRVLF